MKQLCKLGVVATLLTLLLCVITAKAQTTTTSSVLRSIEAILDSAVEGYITDFQDAGSSCSLNAHCPATYGAGYTVNFTKITRGDITTVDTAFTDWNFVQTKQWGTLLTRGVHEELCGARSLRSYWRSGLSIAPQDALKWQYYAGTTDEFGIYPPAAWDCSNNIEANYQPSTRPYFNAASEARDLVIMMDLSQSSTETTQDALTRFTRVKSAATALLNTLNHADFVAIVTYTDTADGTTISGGGLLRATETNKNTIKNGIDALSFSTGYKPADMGAAFIEAARILTQASTGINTANCVQSIVLLTSGRNDIQSRGDKPGQALLELPNTVVNVNLIASSPSTEQTTRARNLACEYDGILRTSWTQDEMDYFAGNLTNYFNSLAVNPTTRWSEPYTDAFGQGRVVSAVRPVYAGPDTPAKFVGVIVADVSVDALLEGGTKTEAQIISDLLDGRVCYGVGRGDQKGVLDALRAPNNCPNPVPPTDIPVNKAGFIALSVFLVPIAAAIAWISPCCSSMRTVRSRVQSKLPFVFILTVAFLIVGFFIVLPVYWAAVYPGQERRDHWDPIVMNVERHEENAYPCCFITQECIDLGPSGPQPVCSFHIRYHKTIQVCNSGYLCCEWGCTDCNCDSEGSCDCCPVCERSVSNAKGTLWCGVCYDPTLTVSFPYKDEILYNRLSINCGQNQTSCRDDYFAANPINNSKIDGLVNPENPDEIRTDPGYNSVAFAAVIVFGVFMALCWILMIVIPWCN